LYPSLPYILGKILLYLGYILNLSSLYIIAPK